MMDATRADGVPMKSGISAADIGGGQVGLLAIVAALERRERTGRGAAIDIAMQDVGAWLTQTRWNAPHAGRASDGARGHRGRRQPDPQTLARELIVMRRDAAGTEWEMLASPLRLYATPPQIGMPIGTSVAGAMDWRDAPAIRRAASAWSHRMTAELLEPLRLRDVELPNRIVVSPMCQYSAVDGCATDWHLVHLGQFAVSGAGLVIVEATHVERRGRITPRAASACIRTTTRRRWRASSSSIAATAARSSASSCRIRAARARRTGRGKAAASR